MKSPWLLEMRWQNIGFLHWRVPVELLERHIPQGWTLDTHANEAWLSVVPFAMANIHARYLPALPGFEHVPELNVRTYIRRGDRGAVFFFSLDAASPAVVIAARTTTGLPYLYADIQLHKNQQAIDYTSVRREPREAMGRFSARYEPMAPATPARLSSVEEFLHERYYFVTRAGLVGRVYHKPYQLQLAKCEIRENTLGLKIEYEFSSTPDLCFYADDLLVRAAYDSYQR